MKILIKRDREIVFLKLFIQKYSKNSLWGEPHIKLFNNFNKEKLNILKYFINVPMPVPWIFSKKKKPFLKTYYNTLKEVQASKKI